MLAVAAILGSHEQLTVACSYSCAPGLMNILSYEDVVTQEEGIPVQWMVCSGVDDPMEEDQIIQLEYDQ